MYSFSTFTIDLTILQRASKKSTLKRTGTRSPRTLCEMSAAATSAPERQSRSEMTFKSCRRWEEETRTAGGCCVVSLQRALACMVYVEMATVAAVAATITLVAVAARRRDRWR